MNTTYYTFQLLCSTVEEWHEVVKRFQPSKRAASKELASALCDLGLEVIAKLEARAAALAKKELKMKRAKELELIPKKRSRRLEAKVRFYTTLIARLWLLTPPPSFTVR